MFENDPVFEPITFPKRFIPETPLLRADIWPYRVAPEMVEALIVFEPARDPYRVVPEIVDALIVLDPRRFPKRFAPDMLFARAEI